MDKALAEMSRTFRAVYSDVGRPGTLPESPLKALLLQCLYTSCSERDLRWRPKTDLLVRWLHDLQPSEEVFDYSVFTHNRERLAGHGTAQKFFTRW